MERTNESRQKHNLHGRANYGFLQCCLQSISDNTITFLVLWLRCSSLCVVDVPIVSLPAAFLCRMQSSNSRTQSYSSKDPNLDDLNTPVNTHFNAVPPNDDAKIIKLANPV